MICVSGHSWGREEPEGQDLAAFTTGEMGSDKGMAMKSAAARFGSRGAALILVALLLTLLCPLRSVSGGKNPSPCPNEEGSVVQAVNPDPPYRKVGLLVPGLFRPQSKALRLQEPEEALGSAGRHPDQGLPDRSGALSRRGQAEARRRPYTGRRVLRVRKESSQQVPQVCGAQLPREEACRAGPSLWHSHPTGTTKPF